MKSLIVLAFALVFTHSSYSQLLKKIADRTKQKTEEKISEKVSNKVSDAATKPIDESGTKKKPADKENNKDQTTEAAEAGEPGPATEGKPSFATYSKYDFVPGEKVLVMEDFMQDAIGDFPAKWNTNASGEIVTLNGRPGRWLMLSKKGRYVPEHISNLPENFTFEFDLVCNDKFNYYSPVLQLVFATGPGEQSLFDWSYMSAANRSGAVISLHPTDAGNQAGLGRIETWADGNKALNNEVSTKQFSVPTGNTRAHVAVWRQKQRLRVYVNQEKIFDIPRAFAAGKNYSNLLYDVWNSMHKEEDRYLIGNLKLAIGAPDTRNKLITEGRFVTRGILFDVNSDAIKPESYGVLKEIAEVLKENSEVKVKIIGHTDSDGSDTDNLLLSKKRAAAVKAMLTSSFGIEGSRMETDGRGEGEPADKNTNAEGKANNRRVEFIKR